MYCTKCGSRFPDDASFCITCGAYKLDPVVAEPPCEAESRPEDIPPTVPQPPDAMAVDIPPMNTDVVQGPPASMPPVYQPEPPYSAGPKSERKKLSKKATLAVILSACAVVIAVAAVFIIPAIIENAKLQKFESAMLMMDDGAYMEAKAVFLNLGEFENAAELAVECQYIVDYNAADKLMSAGNYVEAKAAFEVIASYKDSGARAVECQNEIDYIAATALMTSEDYENAQAGFKKLGSYKDAAALAQDCENIITYREAVALINAGSYTDAKEKLEPLLALGYEDSEDLLVECDNNLDYAEANLAFQQGKFYTAFALFSSLGGFKDSNERAALCEQDYPATGVTYRHGDYTGTAVALKVKTPADDTRPTFLKIYTADGVHVLSVFIHGGDAPTVKLPANTYMIRSAYGEDWYGEEEMFGDDAIYQTLLLEGSKTYAFEKNYTYTLTLRSVEDGNVGAEKEDRKDF